MFKGAPHEMCPSLTGVFLHAYCAYVERADVKVSAYILLYSTASSNCTLCLYSCVLASVLIGLSDEMLLRAVVIAQCPNWQHSLSTSSPWREFDLSGVTTMCFHTAQSVI